MADPFLGQISIFSFAFAPKGWAFCNGQILSIAQNTALFSLLGTTFGGNGQTTFALPNLQGRGPVGVGQGAGLSPYDLGQETGTETVALSPAQMPSHAHAFDASNMKGTLRCRDERGNQRSPAGNVLAREDGLPWWRVVTTTGRLVPGHEDDQARRLLAEGVAVRHRRAGGDQLPVRHAAARR